MGAQHRPEIGFGQIRHARLRLAANRFTYAAWFLRLPLRSLARAPTQLFWLKFNRRGILSVNDADHGDGRPLLTWFDDLLRNEGVTDAGGEVWLHTFPRLFGYVFNPVSFWFAHRADGALRATVCEVNNTFGERHFYLLAHDDGRPLQWGEELGARKVFHVSPFYPVDGRYRFRFMLSEPPGRPKASDVPLGGTARSARGQHEATRTHPKRFVGRIDYDDEHGPSLQTSVSGALVALTDATLLRALIRYPLFTFGVIARIHWQALRLWLKRVPLVSKPAPPEVNVTR